jgi:hypothetical protein
VLQEITGLALGTLVLSGTLRNQEDINEVTGLCPPACFVRGSFGCAICAAASNLVRKLRVWEQEKIRLLSYPHLFIAVDTFRRFGYLPARQSEIT